MKKIAIALIIFLSLSVTGFAQSITLRDTFFLEENTHIGYDLASWDSVLVKIMRGNALVQYVKLTEGDSGEYAGVYVPTYTGDFVAKYYAWYSGEVICVKENFSILDTTAFQGAAAGLTADQIVTEFEDRGYGYGSGTFACTVYTKLSTDSSVIPIIHVIAKNTDQTQLLANGYTNTNGWVVLGLDSIAGGALHKFWLMNIEYSFDFPESADINTDTSVTFYGSAFDYGDPPPENQCAVYDQIFDLALDSLSGVLITTELWVPKDSILRYDDFPISPYRLTCTTGVSGRWRFNLIPNEDLLPLNTWYLFKFKFPTGVEGRYFIYEDSTIVPKQESARYKAISGRM